MSYSVDWVDAFTDRAFSGNGCAVVHDGAALADDVCMAFVKETSLVECTFTGPSKVADVRVRYFLASREIPFAGHPTVATVAAMRRRGLVEDGELVLETLAGPIPVEVRGTRVRMVQAPPVLGETVAAAEAAAVGGLRAEDVVGQPQIVSTGLPFCIAEVRDMETLRRARIDLEAQARFEAQHANRAVPVLEPYYFTRVGVPEGATTFARLMLPPPNPPEDPFTGSATGATAAYLWGNGLLDADSYTAAQGDDMGRPGRALVERLEDGRVAVTGEAYVLMSGQLHL